METSVTEKIVAVVRKAAEMMLTADRNMHVESKEGHGNFVTEYDLRVQNYLCSELGRLFPSAAFIGEEDKESSALPDGECFIIDPIDGTCNFMYDYKSSCISVALLRNREVVAGVICQPYLGEYFTAERGSGAFLNGVSIHASQRPLGNSLVLFGSAPYYPELWQHTLHIAGEMLRIGRDIRRSGTAAGDLCWIAAGRADLFFELRLCPWDFAAGSLICSEAGAEIVQLDGSPLEFGQNCSVVAGSRAAVADFLALGL